LGSSGETRVDRRRRLLALLLAIGLLIACAAALWRLSGGQFDIRRFASSFRQLNWTWLAAGIALNLLSYLGRALRWRVMIAPLRPGAPVGRLVSATFIGFTAVTLFGRPGEVVRPFLIARNEGVSVSSQLAAWLLERIYDLLFVVLMFGVALAVVQPRGAVGPALEWILQAGGYLVACIGGISLAVLVSISLFTEAAVRRIREGLAIVPERYRARLEGWVAAFASGMGSTRRGAFVLKLVVYTVAEWSIIIASTYCLLKAFPPASGMSFTDAVVFLGFVAFGSAVQLPGIGGGFQVAAVLALTELFALSLEHAAAAAVLLWISIFIAIIPIGLALAVLQGLSWSTLRHLDERPELAGATTDSVGQP
jgi:uncharacterized membrane protein YbhN (UPF0104 family)